MTTTHIRGLDDSVELTNIWLAGIGRELGSDDRHEAYRVLCSFLHTLRDRLSVEQAADLASQLPIVIRGAFFQHWQPNHHQSAYRNRSEFLGRFAGEAGITNESDAIFAAEAAMRVLRRHVSAAEMQDIRSLFPQDVRDLLDDVDVHASG
jgi:uncharacterized protein (DUF2267 family)